MITHREHRTTRHSPSAPASASRSPNSSPRYGHHRPSVRGPRCVVELEKPRSLRTRRSPRRVVDNRSQRSENDDSPTPTYLQPDGHEKLTLRVISGGTLRRSGVSRPGVPRAESAKHRRRSCRTRSRATTLVLQCSPHATCDARNCKPLQASQCAPLSATPPIQGIGQWIILGQRQVAVIWRPGSPRRRALPRRTPAEQRVTLSEASARPSGVISATVAGIAATSNSESE